MIADTFHTADFAYLILGALAAGAVLVAGFWRTARVAFQLVDAIRDNTRGLQDLAGTVTDLVDEHRELQYRVTQLESTGRITGRR